MEAAGRQRALSVSFAAPQTEHLTRRAEVTGIVLIPSPDTASTARSERAVRIHQGGIGIT